MQILRKLFTFSIPTHELITIYIDFIRSVVEQSAVVWHSSLTEENRTDLESVQKIALRIILKDEYDNYESALMKVSLETLDNRRENLCLTFAISCTQNSSTNDMFPLNKPSNIRNQEKYDVQYARTDRFKNTAIPHMQRLLNKFNCKKK